MIIRPRFRDHAAVGAYTGRIVAGIGLLMLIPLTTAILSAEWDAALDFAIGTTVCLAFGMAAQTACAVRHELTTTQAVVVAAGSWLFAMTFSAIPLFLSGHYGTFLDAMFDAMSGYTTTGLFLLQDLDHVSNALNMWRFVMTFAGGQGIVVLALAFLIKGSSGAPSLYAREAREDRLLPNIVHTARAIGSISIGWLIVGGTSLAVASLALGQEPGRAFLHGYWVFMGGFSTGGFAPTSFNTFWYHSVVFEMLTIVVFFAGSLNFAVHWALWHKSRREMVRNIETLSFAVTLTLLVVLGTYALARTGIYPDTVVLFRKSFYQLISGHTTTGFSTIYSRAFITQWGPLAMIALIIAMMIGASTGSTAGGIKGLRIGVITKTFFGEIRRVISPRSALIVSRYHHVGDSQMDEGLVRNAFLITVAYLTTYGLLTILGTVAGAPLLDAAFEGVSVASNSGLSCGLLSPATPWGLKAAYVVAMWVGRLEFVSVFGLFGWMYAILRGK